MEKLSTQSKVTFSQVLSMSYRWRKDKPKKYTWKGFACVLLPRRCVRHSGGKAGIEETALKALNYTRSELILQCAWARGDLATKESWASMATSKEPDDPIMNRNPH
ncbi:hypothetical protein JTB14_034453 [Gonioctena quinquepunctata]|nr:hypothetical protein JTB14_034453 [Gonioctena quinquepunctata]